MKRQPIEIYGFGHRLPTRVPRWRGTFISAAGAALVIWIAAGAPW